MSGNESTTSSAQMTAEQLSERLGSESAQAFQSVKGEDPIASTGSFSETETKQIEDFGARLIDDGTLEPLRRFFGGFDAKRLHEQVTGGRATVRADFAGIEMLTVNLKNYAQETVKCRIIGNRKHDN